MKHRIFVEATNDETQRRLDAESLSAVSSRQFQALSGINSQNSSVLTSPPDMVPVFLQIAILTLSLTKRTAPSPKRI